MKLACGDSINVIRCTCCRGSGGEGATSPWMNHAPPYYYSCPLRYLTWRRCNPRVLAGRRLAHHARSRMPAVMGLSTEVRQDPIPCASSPGVVAAPRRRFSWSNKRSFLRRRTARNFTSSATVSPRNRHRQSLTYATVPRQPLPGRVSTTDPQKGAKRFAFNPTAGKFRAGLNRRARAFTGLHSSYLTHPGTCPAGPFLWSPSHRHASGFLASRCRFCSNPQKDMSLETRIPLFLSSPVLRSDHRSSDDPDPHRSPHSIFGGDPARKAVPRYSYIPTAAVLT